ncbi:MAG TPA: penicillin-binding protein 2, partial [Ilumatobacter sp.]|nr:penicillin-binding protein 2 [Ilumatobacter sp.]
PGERIHRFALGQPRRRLIGLLVVMMVMLGYVLFRVGRLQTIGGEPLREAGADQWTRQVELEADRGTIFDRNGEELAVSIPAASISVNPKLVSDPEGTVRTLTTVLGLTEQEQADLYAALVAREKGFVYVKRQIDVSIGQQIADLELSGVNVDPEDRRVLPGGETGRSVIGLTDIDGAGIAGLELQYGGGERGGEQGYTDILDGTPGELTKEVAPKGRSIPGSEQVTQQPVPGDDIILTLDRSIQFAVEEALLGRVSELGAKSGTVVVMDTDTGDVLAMASVDRDDQGAVEITSGNLAAVNAYEPGSVAKVITIAAGLNQGTVTPDSTFVVPWRKKFADDMISDSHQHPDELMSVEHILVESSNIGTIAVQMSLGEGDWDLARQTHWEYMRRFGLGERTALNFPGESTGILKHWSDLWGSERVTVAYGQGVASTSIQLVSAVNALANDGTYVAPRLVQGYVGPDGEVVDADPSETREVITPEVAHEMQRMMREVVCDASGTGELAQRGVENFAVAGKTGTGLKAQEHGYLNAAGERVYYASFVGFFPAEDPQVTVLVSIDEPPAGDINRFGGTAAAPVFAGLVPVIAHEMGLVPPAGSTPSCAG